MADLVSAASKSQLSARNSEASHLTGASYTDLGGPTWDHKGGPDAYKIDATKEAKSQDTTVPHAVGSEPTHLKGVSEDEKVDVDFDGDKEKVNEADDLDKELDKFEKVDEADVDIEVDDDDDKKKLKEDVKEIPDAKAKGAESTTDQTDDFVKEDGEDADSGKLPFSAIEEDDEEDADKKDDLKEGELPPWLKKGGDDKDDDKVDESDEDDEDQKKVDEADEDDEDKKDKIEESVRLRIKLPKAPLFESVDPKARKAVGVIYEQALRATTKQIASQLQEHYQKKLTRLVESRDRVMAKQVDSYLTYVTEEWVKQNKLAVRQNLRASLSESLLDGLAKLFKEHYIDVPQSKVDVVKTLTNQVNEMKKKLNEAHGRSMKLHRLAEAANKQRIVSQFGRGLSEAQVAKLAKLTEDVPYTNAKDFRAKLTMLKENYFGEAKKKSLTEQRLPEEDLQEEKKSATKSDIDVISDVLSRQARADKW